MQLIRLSRTLATILGMDNWWCNNSFYPKCSYEGGSTVLIPKTYPPQYTDHLLYLTQFQPAFLNLPAAEKKHAHEIYERIKNNPNLPTPPLWFDCLSEASLPAWKLKLTDRWYSLTFLNINYDPARDPFGAKTNATHQTFTMENYTCQTGKHGYQDFIKTDINDGEYVDILVTTCNSLSVLCASSSTYGDVQSAPYFKSTNIPLLPQCVLKQTLINCNHVQKIPYNITFSLRHPSIVTTKISCPFIPENVYSGILEETLEIIFNENKQIDGKETFTTSYFELDRPMHHSLTIQPDEQQLSFKTETRYVPDLEKLFFNSDNLIYDLSAISYYLTNSILLSKSGSPVRLTIYFSQIQND